MIRPLRRNPTGRVDTRAPSVADEFATPPGPPQKLRTRGGEELAVLGGSARLDGGARHTQRVSMALRAEGEDRSRDRRASDLTGRTLAIGQGQTLRWLVEVCVPAGKAPEGGEQWTTQPGEEGARQRVLLSLVGAHGLCLPPAHLARRKHNLPASAVGSRRASGHVECLVDVIQALVASDASQGQRPRFTQALHARCARGRSKQHLSQRHRGRLDPTPSLKDRAEEGMRHMPARST